MTHETKAIVFGLIAIVAAWASGFFVRGVVDRDPEIDIERVQVPEQVPLVVNGFGEYTCQIKVVEVDGAAMLDLIECE